MAVPTTDRDLLSFISSSFRSVWALELVLLLKAENRAWTRGELVEALRASDLVVGNALEALVAGGMVSMDEHAASYMPVNDQIAGCLAEVEKLYRSKPDAVRRVIISASASSASAFANAFKLRKD